jgi:hypothetical protein
MHTTTTAEMGKEELERRLKCRVDREELVKKNILPGTEN